MLEMFGMLIGGLMLWRLLRELREVSCDGDPPVSVTVPVAGGGVSGSGNVTSGSVRSPSSVPFPSLPKTETSFSGDASWKALRAQCLRGGNRARRALRIIAVDAAKTGVRVYK